MFSIPLPNLDAKSVKELEEYLEAFKEASEQGPVRGGVVVEGDAAAYALVWEWGNARQTKKGPKTVLGTNPDGEQVWLSIQAPFGYIRISEPEYVQILQDELGNVELDEGSEIIKEMQLASAKAANRIAKLISENAPKDTGQLQDSIIPADPNDQDLVVDSPDIELGSTDFKHEALIKSAEKK